MKVSLHSLLNLESNLNEIEFLGIPLGGVVINKFYLDLYFNEISLSYKTWALNIVILIKNRVKHKIGYYKTARVSYGNKILMSSSSSLEKNLGFFFPIITASKNRIDDFIICLRKSISLPHDGLIVSSNFNLTNIELSVWKTNYDLILSRYKKIIIQFLIENNIPEHYFIGFLNDFQYQTKLLTYFNHRFLNDKPRLVLTDYDRYCLNSAIILTAKKFNVPTYTFIHGSTFPPDHFYPLLADKIFVWGEIQKMQFLSLDIKEDKIIVVGNQKVSRRNDKLPIQNLTKTIIVLASNNFEITQRLNLVRMFCNVAKELPNMEFWIRLHPLERIKDYSKLKSEFPKVRFMPNSEQTSDEIFQAASIIVGHNSTFLFDGFVNGKSIIILNPEFVEFPLGLGHELNKYGGVDIAIDENSLKILLLKNLNRAEDSLDKKISYFCYSFGDEAVDLILKEIGFLIKSS